MITEESPESSQNFEFGPINNLTEDCLVHIFEHLPIVSNLWRSSSLKSWSQVKFLRNVYPFVNEQKDSDSKFIRENDPIGVIRQLLLRCGQFLKGVEICSHDVSVNEQTIFMLPMYCPNLDKLTIRQISSSKCLRKLIYGCHEITFLHVFFAGCKEYLEEDLSRLFQSKKKLKDISFSSYSLMEKCLLHLPEDIEKISILKCIPSRFYLEGIPQFKKLQSLSLYNVDISGLLPTLTNFCQRSMEDLTLIACTVQSEDDINRIREFKNLRHLYIFASWITDPLLEDVGRHCRKLSSICLVGSMEVMVITDRGIEAIASLPDLQVLEITRICLLGTCFKRMQKLRKFKCTDCRLLTDDALCELIQSAPNLEFLGALNFNFSQNNCKVVEVAVEVTRARKNGVCLEIRTSMSENDWICVEHLSGKSPYLRLVNVKPSGF